MTTPATYGSLFTGIGALDLGVELATGARALWLVEQDPACRAVLADHWPDTLQPGDGDASAIDPATVEPVDLLIGGFPCQPVSLAGLGAANHDPRWLWPVFARWIEALQPAAVLVENVPGLLTRGLAAILADLHRLGYSASWRIISACSVGAPHRRDRVFITAARGTPPPTPADYGPADYWTTIPPPDLVIRRPYPPNRTTRTRQTGNAVVPAAAYVAAIGLNDPDPAVLNGIEVLTMTPAGWIRAGSLFPEPDPLPRIPRTGALTLEGSILALDTTNHEHQPECSTWPTPLSTDASQGMWQKDGPNYQLRLPGAARIADVMGEPPPTSWGVTRPCAGATHNHTPSCAMWPTPRARLAGPDYAAVESRGRSGPTGARSSLGTVTAALASGRWRRLDDGTIKVVDPRTVTQGALNPEFAEWLMGIPVGWTDTNDPLRRPAK